MIGSLQAFRAIFSFLIFLMHYEVGGVSVFYDGGDFGVTYFFILSGYVLTLAEKRHMTHRKQTTTKFLAKRLIKIYPIHLLCLIIAIVLGCKGGTSVLIANILLLQSWYPDSGWFFSFNSVSWFLSSILFAYTMFPLLIRFIYHKTRIFCIVLFSTALIWSFAIFLIPSDLRLAIVYINPAVRLIDFCIGILLCVISKKCTDNQVIQYRLKQLPLLKRTIIEVLIIIIASSPILIYDRFAYSWSLSVLWWLPTCMIILTFSIMDKHQGLLSRFFNSKILLWFGSISFEFYIIHLLIIRTFNEVNNFDNLNPYIQFISILVITVVLSYFLKVYFVNKITRLISGNKRTLKCNDNAIKR